MFNAKDKIRLEFIICLLFLVIILSVFCELPSHEFLTFDDHGYITKNTHVHEGITRGNIVWSFRSTDFGYWHPLTWMSHMVVFQLFGLNPAMHHLINLLLHITNTLLLFFVFKRMSGALWQSALVAVLFGLHPLNVESVAWASERKNVLSTFFWMLTILTYVRYTEKPNFYRYLPVFFVFVWGLMSKPTLVTLPFVLLLLDYWPLSRVKLIQSCSGSQEALKSIHSEFRKSLVLRVVLEKIPLFILASICIYLSALSFQRLNIEISTTSIPVKLRFANALVSYVGYIKKMIWPHNLTVYYPYPTTLPVWQICGAFLLLICVTFLAFRWVRSKPYFTVGWLWYIGTLVPATGLVQAGLWPAMADRFVYVPLIGLFIIIAWGMNDLVGRWPHKKIEFIVIVVTLLSILAVITMLQIKHWQNGVTLFTHSIRVTHNNNLAHYELGNALERQGDFNKAIFHYSEALKINPNYAQAHNNLGYILAQQGDYKNAIYHYNEALRIKPDYTEAHNNLGTVLLYQGNYQDAIYHYNEALRSDPNYAGVYYNLGKIYLNQGKIERAILLYRKALELNPEMTQVLYNLSWVLASHEDEKYRNGQEAVKLAEMLCKTTQYKQPLALDALAAAYAETGRFEKAVATAEKALQLALQIGPKELVLGLKKRLKLYKTGQPYQENLRRKNES